VEKRNDDQQQKIVFKDQESHRQQYFAMQKQQINEFKTYKQETEGMLKIKTKRGSNSKGKMLHNPSNFVYQLPKIVPMHQNYGNMNRNQF
jgi:hypothetical protein